MNADVAATCSKCPSTTTLTYTLCIIIHASAEVGTLSPADGSVAAAQGQCRAATIILPTMPSEGGRPALLDIVIG